MRFKVWFDDFTDTLRIEEVTSIFGAGPVVFVLLLAFLLGFFVIGIFAIPFLIFFGRTKKITAIDERLSFWARKNMKICVCYCVLLLLSTLLVGQYTALVAPMMIFAAIISCVYTLILLIRNKNSFIENNSMKQYKKAINIAIWTGVCTNIFYSILRVLMQSNISLL